jgi:hypothetical protein
VWRAHLENRHGLQWPLPVFLLLQATVTFVLKGDSFRRERMKFCLAAAGTRQLVRR